MIFNTRNIACPALALMALALCSCSADRDPETDGQGDMSLRISFDPGDATRAGSDSESHIDSVDVLLFTDAGDSTPGTLYDRVEARNLSPRAGGYDFDATVSLDDPDIPRGLVAVLVCNADAVDFGQLKGKSYEYVSRALVDRYDAAGCAEITMSGQCVPAVDTRLKAQRLRASVARDRARVDVDASAVDEKAFSLSEIYVYRHNDMISMLPLPGIRLNVPEEASKVPSSKFVVSPEGNAVMAQVYIPEADLVMGGDGDPSDQHRLERTALVVGGHYREGTAMSYYRVDFTDADGRITDVIRNHRYVVNITGVNGPGSDNPDDAYSSITAGITATVIDWERSDSHIVFDGAHWLSVESRAVTVGPDAGNGALLPVASDIPASEWELAWAGDGDTALPADMREASVLEGRFFRVTCPDGDIVAGRSLLFEALSPLPDGVDERSETLHILAAGRLHLWIRVTQRDLGSSPWTDGGGIKGTEIFE